VLQGAVEKGVMLATGKAEQGFTLIEMLVVLAILGLVTGIAFPSLERTIAQQRYHLAIAAVEVALHDARANSIAKSTETSFASPPLPDDIAITVTRGGVRFYGDGSANGGSIAIAMGPRNARFTIDPATGLIGREG
jgi:general secretion pathway protein H